MVDWNSLHTSERILEWRRFRQKLNDDFTYINKTVLKVVAEYWASMPRVHRVVDYYTPSSWPTPWELLHDNLFCESAVSLMMYYSLALLDSPDVERLSMNLIDDGTDVYLIPVYDEKFALNYSYVKVSSLPHLKSITILTEYKNNEIPKIR